MVHHQQCNGSHMMAPKKMVDLAAASQTEMSPDQRKRRTALLESRCDDACKTNMKLDCNVDTADRFQAGGGASTSMQSRDVVVVAEMVSELIPEVVVVEEVVVEEVVAVINRANVVSSNKKFPKEHSKLGQHTQN